VLYFQCSESSGLIWQDSAWLPDLFPEMRLGLCCDSEQGIKFEPMWSGKIIRNDATDEMLTMLEGLQNSGSLLARVSATVTVSPAQGTERKGVSANCRMLK
jgi:hypothetical protein